MEPVSTAYASIPKGSPPNRISSKTMSATISSVWNQLMTCRTNPLMKLVFLIVECEF